MLALCIVLAALALSGWWLAFAFWLEEDPTSVRRILCGLRLALTWVGRVVEHRDLPSRAYVCKVARATPTDEQLGLDCGADVKEHHVRAVGPWWRRRWGHFLHRWYNERS